MHNNRDRVIVQVGDCGRSKVVGRARYITATVRIYDLDASLDIFWVELFGRIRCDEDEDIDTEENTFGSRE